MNWLTIAVIVLLLLFTIHGYRKGFIKIVVSFAATIAAMILVGILTPYIGNFLKEKTPLYDNIKNECAKRIESQLAGGGDSNGIDSNQLEYIDSLNLPQFMRNLLTENYEDETYSELSVSTFTEYIASYLTKFIINGIAYVVTFIILLIVFRIVIKALNIMAKLPVINGINRFAGLVVGLSQGILILWILFLVITILASTSIGKSAFAMINESAFLTYLYEKNLLLNIISSVLYR